MIFLGDCGMEAFGSDEMVVKSFASNGDELIG